MSLYTDYQKKIAPWAKAWHFVVKHKVLILSAMAAIFVATGTLLGIKGIVVNDGLNADMNFSYGEKYHFGGDAIMGDVHYEYREIGSDTWTEVPPSDAGTYEVRASSKNSFGGTYYSQYKTFTIAKKESPLSIVGDQLTYGEKPNISMDMVPGDQIASFDYDYDDISKDNPIVTIKDVVIKDSVGKNVTSNYEFTLPSKEMELLPRPITIRGESMQVEYSGKNTEGGQYKITYGSLVDGDKIITEHNDLPIYTLDTLDNITNVTIENGRGQDVTKHYQINLDKGSLSMTKRYLAITSASLSKEYDGKPFSVDDDPNLETYTVNTELGLGDSLSVTFNAQTEENVGTYDNDFSYHLDNSQYYVVEKNIGKITIRRRKLTLDFVDNLTYNGETFENRKDETYTSSGLVPGHRIDLEYENGTAFFPNRSGVTIRVFSETDEDVTSNYEIIQNGWTSFSKAPLKITCSNVNALYDGKVHSGSFTVEGLLDCDAIEYNNELANAIYPTSMEYSMSIKRIYNKESGESRTAYYDISSIPGLFTINKRHLDIDAGIVRTYTGGDSLTRDYDESEYTLFGDGLADGDALRLFPIIGDYSGLGVDVGWTILDSDGQDITNICYEVGIIGDGPKNYAATPDLVVRAIDKTVTYDGHWHSLDYEVANLQPGDHIIYRDTPTYKDAIEFGERITPQVARIENADGKDVTAFYNIHVESGTLKILPRELTIGVHLNRVYDGREASISPYISEDEYEFLDGTSLADTDEIKINYFASNHLNDDPAPYLYGGADEIYAHAEISDIASGNPCQGNYSVAFLDPSFNAQKADLHVKGADYSLVYDSNEHGGTWNTTGLQGSDSVAIETASLPRHLMEPCEVTYTPEVRKIEAADSSDRTPYYNITTESGTIRIEKRDVSIDIAPHTDPIVWRYSSDSPYELAGYDVLDITPRINGDATVGFDCKIFNQDGKDVTESCYNLTINDASGKTRYFYSLEAMIDGSPSDYHAKYDGRKHYLSSRAIKDGSIDDVINTRIMTSGDDSGIYDDYSFYAYKPCQIGATPVVESIKGRRVSKGQTVIDDTSMFFYDPTSTTSVSLEIEPRNLTIAIFGTRIYEGATLDYELADSEYSLGGDGLAPDDRIIITPNESTIFSGGDVEYSVSIFNPTLGDVTDCYNIQSISDSMSYQKATLTLTSSPDDNTWDFDGKTHNPVVTGEALDGDVVSVSTDISDSGGKSNAGTYDYEVTKVSITKDNKDVTKYYDVTNPDYSSSMTINKVDVYITFDFRPGFDTSTYDDLGDLFKGYEIESHRPGVLPVLDFTNLHYSAVPKVPGVYNTEDFVSGIALRLGGVDVTENYNIHVLGQFEIRAAALSISAPTYYRAYDGTEISGDVSRCIIVFTDGMEKEGYRVTNIVLEGSITTPGSVTLRIVSFTIVDGKGNVVTMPVSVNEGSLTITPRSITVATADVYDYVGEIVDGGEPYIIAGSLANGDHIFFFRSNGASSSTSYDHAGTYENDGWTLLITDKNGNSVTDYYNITIIWGTIYIED